MSGNLYRLPIMIVALVIGIIMVTAVILPLSSEYSEAKTFTNEGLYYMENVKADSDKEFVLEYTKTPYSMTINGIEIDMSNINNNRYTFATDGETWLIRMSNPSQNLGFAYVDQGYAPTTTDAISETITMSGGNLSFSATMSDESTVTRTQTYNEMWIYSPTKTDWVMKNPTEKAYMLDDSPLYAYGTTTISHWYDFIGITGNVTDFDPTILYPEVTTTVTDKVAVMTNITGYVGLHELDKLTFTISDGTNTVNATYSYFIVPYEVSADPDNPAAYKSLVMVIPLMAFVVLVVAAAAMIYYKKD